MGLGASLSVAGADLQRQATEELMGLREEPAAIALVNRDITPENLLAHGEWWVGLVEQCPCKTAAPTMQPCFSTVIACTCLL